MKHRAYWARGLFSPEEDELGILPPVRNVPHRGSVKPCSFFRGGQPQVHILFVSTAQYVRGVHSRAGLRGVNAGALQNARAVEGLTAVLDYAFSTMQMNRLEAFVMPMNIPSIRLLEKLGFKNEGLMREYGYWRGEFHDLQLYSILKGDVRFLPGESGKNMD